MSVKSYRMRIETEDPLYYGWKKLKVRGKDLANISDSVFHLLELEVLDLSPEREACLDYKLPACPPTIGRLVNLKVLMLDTNELKDLPPEIALLQQLERIALSNNHFSSLPSNFCNLKNLQSLHMANNDFKEFPLQLCKLENLEFLDISDNHISSLPEEIRDMKQLETLLLFINDLTKLPDIICTLTQLRCLWIGNNRIRQLPRDFGKLLKLDWGFRYTSSALDGNPLIHPPIEICRMGPDAIDRYMSSLSGRKSRNNDTDRSDGDRINGY
ncbi:leucine-rich repeat and death domain-containing protein 1-like [Haliotis rufescens]|uniref:leucine-rich repeat and death domain-containing protein 1-like n=1 Tax=Haliotis rufescens TaxID=6454 RepID=UPI001EB04E33|nr:leucine-rich repeat and death domain-containing protein 1-like [Haliotis rufescens]XP_046345996.1 leucine-rich repeat and death domain-containing protein 1-like [Haliotis rufescens]